MMDFQLNLGLALARPYESDYAILRRCLFANPGIPFSVIKEHLRALLPNVKKVSERLRALHHDIPVIDMPEHCLRTPDSYRRQCPECAKELYHTDAYALPWITHCPIHQKELVETCPICGEKWPDQAELAKRDCTCCGIPAYSDMAEECLSRIRHQSYQPIIDLYSLFGVNLEKRVSIQRKDLRSAWAGSWLINVPITSEKFASFRARRRYTDPTKALKHFKLKQSPVLCKTAALHAPKTRDKAIWELDTPWGKAVDIDIRKSSPELLDADFRVMARITRWIAEHTNHSAPLHITSYRYLDWPDHAKRPTVCPYCLALSLWFFNTTTMHYGIDTQGIVHDYPFLSEAGVADFYTAYEPLVSDAVIGGNIYETDKDFSLWFYARGLEIAFIDILTVAVCLVNHYWKVRTTGHSPPHSYLEKREHSDQLYLADIEEELLYFYYENENPLDKLMSSRIKSIGKICERYHRHLWGEEKDGNGLHIGSISGGELTAAKHSELLEQFHGYLIRLRNNYWRLQSQPKWLQRELMEEWQ